MSEITEGKKRFVKRALSKANPTVWIGKGGVSEDIVKEIEKQLERSKMVKVKILKSALSDDKTKQIACNIATQTEASLVEIRGHTFMLYKPHKR